MLEKDLSDFFLRSFWSTNTVTQIDCPISGWKKSQKKVFFLHEHYFNKNQQCNFLYKQIYHILFCLTVFHTYPTHAVCKQNLCSCFFHWQRPAVSRANQDITGILYIHLFIKISFHLVNTAIPHSCNNITYFPPRQLLNYN